MDQIDVSIIYVNWNCSAEMMESIASLRKIQVGCTYEIIVVDNNSSEDISILKQDYIHLVKSPVNGGFGTGCNLGARAARGKYLLFLNPDTVARNDVPGILFEFMEQHPEAGACGSVLFNADGTVNYNAGRRHLSLVNEILEHSTLCFRFPKVPFIGRPYYGDWDHRSTREVESLCGACMMFRKDVFQALGGFDERFFMYCEESDLCRRTWKAGYKIYYVHRAELVHTCLKSSLQYYGELLAINMQYLKSSEIYYRKNYGPIRARLWRWGIGLLYGIRYLFNRRPDHLQITRWGFSNV